MMMVMRRRGRRMRTKILMIFVMTSMVVLAPTISKDLKGIKRIGKEQI